MDPATLNLTTEVLGHARFCFLRIDAARVDRALRERLDASRGGLENMHFADGHPGDAQRRQGRYQLLRSIADRCADRDLPDPGIAQANVLVRLEGSVPEPLAAYVDGLQPLVAARGGSLAVYEGIAKPRSYTSYAMTQFAYAHARSPASGAEHPIGVVTPQNKTPAWWAMDWMQRESFFLPRYDAAGRMIAQGHALASAAGVPGITRRLVHHPQGYGLGRGYDFIGYFEFAAGDAPVFREVMARLRDREQNPEWDYVREGPEWWGQRVGHADALWQI